MKRLLFFLTLLISSVSSLAQESNKLATKFRKEDKLAKINAGIRAAEEGIIAYKKHMAFGFMLTSDGFGCLIEKGYAKSIAKATLFQLEITERKHQKEEKQSNPTAPSASIIYGKLNFFYPVKLGVQKQFLLGNKSNKNGVSISGNIGGGLSLGLLRAYEVEVNKAGKKTFVRYDSPDSLLFKNGPYYGGPNFSKGWNRIKMTPGLYIKPALRFDYGRYNDLLAAIEVGLIAEYYSKKIPQMLYNKENKFFFSAYFTVLFGKRK